MDQSLPNYDRNSNRPPETGNTASHPLPAFELTYYPTMATSWKSGSGASLCQRWARIV
jgi:hypothetical protein